MTLMMTRSLFLVLLWNNIPECRAEDLPIRFEDFLAVLDGLFDNFHQWSEDRLHDRIEFSTKPVLIPGLRKDPVMYYEEALNGNLYRRGINARDESSTDYRLYVTYYNFTDPRQYKPGAFNTDDLANYTREDFSLNEGCQEIYTQPFPGVIFGEFFDCRHAVKERHPVYTAYLRCDVIHFEPPLAANETTSLLEYELRHRGPRYPLINPPADYINPCKDGL